MFIPTDNYLLLSLLNTKLRDNFSSLADLCEDCDWEQEEIESRMAAIGYAYCPQRNAFKEKV